MTFFRRGSSARPLRYFLYISETKVDNLLPQIPPKFLRTMGFEVSVNAMVASAVVRRERPEEPVALSTRVSLLSDYIVQHERVGTIEDPAPYIGAVSRLRFGVVADYASELAFFGGEVDGVKLGLIGSSSSMVGAADPIASDNGLEYYTLLFLNGVVDQETLSPGRAMGIYEPGRAIDLALQLVPAQEHRLEFLAKTIRVEDGLVLATPIYVAMAD
ncbi:DUF7019 family protein [Glycomyces buryatensis]|uniref:Uncharacterized protein n=1 Tax=Glycomyces buryatensis TaxID=2570927 RepID=A0A4S8QCH6_9ACTN|nr:SAVMC3_10250 family protein [Glycomyces buryatensis]THV42227.1 hypothetical protein FAB82_07410 [Glycomyces buryatensis]